MPQQHGAICVVGVWDSGQGIEVTRFIYLVFCLINLKTETQICV